MAKIYPQALGSFSITSYDSQDYGGGILSRLHAVMLREELIGNFPLI
jgi:hypothetical protein